MDSFVLHLDLSEVIEKHKELAATIEKRLAVAAKSLAVQGHAHVLEEAAKKLHSRHDMFTEHFRIDRVDNGHYSIVVPREIRWIEDGMEPHSMLDDLLKSPKAKTRKKGGGKYIIIPFKHDKAPTRSTPHQATIRDALKKELKALDVPYKKIERGTDGQPKFGLLHKIDLHKFSPRQAQGKQGPAGWPMATHSLQNGVEGPEGRPYLMGVRIYQKPKRNPDGSVRKDKNGKMMASREIFTFRVASTSQAGSGKWFHPGLAPMHFLDEAYTFLKTIWDAQVSKEILRDLNISS